MALFHPKHLLQAGAALLSSAVAEHRYAQGRDKRGKVTELTLQ
jgi:hypothetical protein